jgi:hypothetical protein
MIPEEQQLVIAPPLSPTSPPTIVPPLTVAFLTEQPDIEPYPRLPANEPTSFPAFASIIVSTNVKSFTSPPTQPKSPMRPVLVEMHLKFEIV